MSFSAGVQLNGLRLFGISQRPVPIILFINGDVGNHVV